MTEPKRISLLCLVLLAVFGSLVMWDFAHADDDHGHGQAHHGDSETTVIESQAVKRSVGVGLSGGDMDINDCLATHVILFGIWQGTHTNPYCEALRHDAEGNYQAAAEMRCSTRKYKKVYGKGKACIDAVIRTAPVRTDEELTGEMPDTDDARYAEQQEEIEYLREENASIVGQLKHIAQQIERAPSNQQQVQQQVDAGAERRARSLKAYEEALAKGSEQ